MAFISEFKGPKAWSRARKVLSRRGYKLVRRFSEPEYGLRGQVADFRDNFGYGATLRGNSTDCYIRADW